MTTLSCTRGDTFTWTATIKATDVTASTLWFTVKRAKDEISDVNDALALVKNYWPGNNGSAVGINVTATTPDSTAVVTIAPTVTATFDPRLSYVWDLQWKTTAGAVETLDSGALTVSADVTERTTTP